MAFYEDIIIRLGGVFVPQAFDDLKKALNEERNALNALARETEKGTAQWTKYKNEVKEINRVLKLSGSEFASYFLQVKKNQREQELLNASTSKLTKTTSAYGVKLGNVKSNLGQYSNQLLQVAQSTDQGTDAITKQVGQLALFAGGWISVASAVYLAVDANRDWVNTQLESIPLMNELVYEINRMQIAIGTQDVLSKNEGEWQDYSGSFANDMINKKTKEIADAEFMVKQKMEWERTHPKAEKTGGKGTTLRQAKEDLDKIETLQKQLTKLEADKLGYISKYGEQAQIVLDTLKEIEKTQREIARLTSPSRTKIYDTAGVVVSNTGRKPFTTQEILNAQYQAESDYIGNIRPEEGRNTLEDANSIYGAVSSTMSVLQIGTEGFVGTMISGFNTVLTIMQAIKTVNSILSFIPGFAEGGSVPTGSPFWVGERGRELMFLNNNGGYVMNNSDSMRYMSNVNKNNINLYVSGNIDVSASLKAQQKKYNYITIN